MYKEEGGSEKRGGMVGRKGIGAQPHMNQTSRLQREMGAVNVHVTIVVQPWGSNCETSGVGVKYCGRFLMPHDAHHSLFHF